MTSLPQLPPELQRLLRERNRRTSLAEAEVLTGRAMATETRRTSVDDVGASEDKERRPTGIESEQNSEGPEVHYQSFYTDCPVSMQPSFGFSAEPSLFSRPGTGTGYSYSPFRDAGPDEISWISRYRNYSHPPRPPRRPLLTGVNHYPTYSSSSPPSSSSYRPCTNCPTNPFSVVPCQLLPRSRDAERSASSDGLLWRPPASLASLSCEHAIASSSEARRRHGGAGLTSSSHSGAMRVSRPKSWHPLRRSLSAHRPPGSTNERGPPLTGREPRYFKRQVAGNVAALDELCLSITICRMVGEDRPAASPRSGATKKLRGVANRGKNQEKVRKLDRIGKRVLRNTDEVDAIQRGDVAVEDGMSGPLSSVNGTVPVDDRTNMFPNGSISANDGTDDTTSGTILTPTEKVTVNNGTDHTRSETILNTDGKVTVSDGTEANRSGKILSNDGIGTISDEMNSHRT